MLRMPGQTHLFRYAAGALLGASLLTPNRWLWFPLCLWAGILGGLLLYGAIIDIPSLPFTGTAVAACSSGLIFLASRSEGLQPLPGRPAAAPQIAKRPPAPKGEARSVLHRVSSLLSRPVEAAMATLRTWRFQIKESAVQTVTGAWKCCLAAKAWILEEDLRAVRHR